MVHMYVIYQIVEMFYNLNCTAAHILTRTKEYEHITPILKDVHLLPIVKGFSFNILREWSLFIGVAGGKMLSA